MQRMCCFECLPSSSKSHSLTVVSCEHDANCIVHDMSNPQTVDL